MSSTHCVTTLQTRFLDLLNGLRQRRGLSPLEVDANLHAAATFRAEDMVKRNYFSYETPGRGSAREVIEQFGYDADLTGENICWGERTAEEAFDTWVTSQDHFENMVSPHYAAIGIGGPVGAQFQDQMWGLWVTTFGSALSSRAGSCDADAGVGIERPDKPPRRLRLSRERPPREERGKHRGKDKDDDKDRDRKDKDKDGHKDRRDRSDKPLVAVGTPPAGPVVGPSPAPSGSGALTGPILTAAPWGSFGIGWDQINRWDEAISQASAEFDVPAERIKAHIVIESSGQPDAIQKNDQNGWSFGLMQVVPRWWNDFILQLAGRADTGQSEREVGQLLLDDPVLAVRAGTGVLKSFFDGDWDRTSSKFFLGNPNWSGGDTVSGNTGLQYKAMLDGLIAEIQVVRELGGIMSRPTGTGLPQSELITTVPAMEGQEAERRGERATRGTEAMLITPAGAIAGTGAADCPEGYVVKGNASSRIYHVPGGNSYGRTMPEICFATAEDAEAAGFRAAKR